jgi:hypothetical protein
LIINHPAWGRQSAIATQNRRAMSFVLVSKPRTNPSSRLHPAHGFLPVCAARFQSMKKARNAQDRNREIQKRPLERSCCIWDFRTRIRPRPPSDTVHRPTCRSGRSLRRDSSTRSMISRHAHRRCVIRTVSIFLDLQILEVQPLR